MYAYGGNPDAAELAGINTRWTILKTYVLMGVLCALARGDRRRPAQRRRRSTSATSYELYVIAAAVVGGTSFAGGIGTIPGAVLGAFVHAVAGLRPELPRRQLARPERRGGHRADPRRRPRHPEPPARLMSEQEDTAVTVAERTPLVEMRNINVAFGGVHAVRDVTHRPVRRARSSASSAATAPASRR